MHQFFALLLRYFGPLVRSLVAYHLVRGGMPLHDAVEVNCEKGAAIDINQDAGA